LLVTYTRHVLNDTMPAIPRWDESDDLTRFDAFTALGTNDYKIPKRGGGWSALRLFVIDHGGFMGLDAWALSALGRASVDTIVGFCCLI